MVRGGIVDLTQGQKGEFGPEFHFSDLFVWAIRQQFTGWVRIQAAEGDIRAVFKNGAPSSVTGPGVREDHLGGLLVKLGLCAAETIDQLVAKQQALPVAERSLIGEMLAAERHLTPAAVRNGLIHQTTRRFATLFALDGESWASTPSVPPQLERYGQSMDGYSLLIKALKGRASDAELDLVTARISDWAVRLGVPLTEARRCGADDQDNVIIKLLVQPRRLVELEEFCGDKRAARSVIRALMLCEMLEPVDAAETRPPTLEEANAPEALPLDALTELPAPPAPVPMAFAGEVSPPLSVISSISSTFPVVDPNVPLYSEKSDPAMPIDPNIGRRGSVPPPILGDNSSLPQTDASQSLLGTIGNIPRTTGSPVTNRIPGRPKNRGKTTTTLGRIRTNVRRRNDVPVHMKLVVDELVELHEKMETGDAYELLGIGPDASIDEAKSKYRKLASRFNPEILSSQLPEDLAAIAHALAHGLAEARDEVTTPKAKKGEKAASTPGSTKPAAGADSEEMERRYKMGQVFLNSRQYAKAREQFEFCMERDRYNGLYRAYYGWAIYSDPAERANDGAARAYDAIREASLLDQNEPLIQVYLGTLLRERGDLSHAASVLRRALRSDPNNAAARRELNAIQAEDPSIQIDAGTDEALAKSKKGLFNR